MRLWRCLLPPSELPAQLLAQAGRIVGFLEEKGRYQVQFRQNHRLLESVRPGAVPTLSTGPLVAQTSASSTRTVPLESTQQSQRCARTVQILAMICKLKAQSFAAWTLKALSRALKNC